MRWLRQGPYQPIGCHAIGAMAFQGCHLAAAADEDGLRAPEMA